VIPNQIIIADDGSEADTFAVAKNWDNQLNINHIWHENIGFRKCKILNKSIHEISSPYVIFLDGDCLPHKHFVRDHSMMAEQGYFVQGRRCFVQENKVSELVKNQTSILKLAVTGSVSGLFKSVRLPWPYIKRNKTMYGLLGCNLGVWRDDLIKINGFDEDYEGWGREDSDLCARLYNAGISRKMVYGRALVYHLNHPENDRGNLKKNDKLLKEAIRSGKTRCTKGIFRELGESNGN
jgi:glycosyltransferase involved in cell wall biosynthesis